MSFASRCEAGSAVVAARAKVAEAVKVKVAVVAKDGEAAAKVAETEVKDAANVLPDCSFLQRCVGMCQRLMIQSPGHSPLLERGRCRDVVFPKWT